MTIRSTPPWVKTETAADHVQRPAHNPLTRAHAADVQQAIAVCRVADSAVDAAAAPTGLLTAVAECAGSSWLKANTDDPRRRPVGAENSVILCNLGILADQAAEPVPPYNPDVCA